MSLLNVEKIDQNFCTACDTLKKNVSNPHKVNLGHGFKIYIIYKIKNLKIPSY